MTQAGSGATEQPDQPAGASTEGAPHGGARAGTPPARWSPATGFRTGLVLAVVLVLGFTLGAVAVGLLGDTPPPMTDGRADVEAGNDGLVLGDLDPDAGPYQVNEACLGAVNALQDAYATVDDLGQAAAALDAAQLDEVVRRLQPLQRQLETDIAACEVREIEDEPSGETTAPSGSATRRTPETTSPPD
jgi:hypothetical protein